MKRIHACTLLFVCTLATSLGARPLPIQKLLLIDTGEHESYQYTMPFAHIARSVGLATDYHPISSIADTPIEQFASNDYSTVFAIIEPTFLMNLHTSTLAQKVLHLLAHYSAQPQTRIGIFLSPKISVKKNVVKSLEPLFRAIGINPPPTTSETDEEKKLHLFSVLIDSFYSLPLEHRSFRYHKTLASPRTGFSLVHKLNTALGQTFTKKLTSGAGKRTAFLPINSTLNEKTDPLSPLGIYHYNNQRHNHLLISSSSLLTHSSIAESFHLCPSDFALRRNIHEAVQHLLYQFSYLGSTHTAQQSIKSTLTHLPNKPSLPFVLAPGERDLSVRASTKHTIPLPQKVAWMEVFVHHEQKKLDTLVDNIVQAELDALWISIAPNMYYHSHGRHKNDRSKLLAALGNFTSLLKQKAQKVRKNVPRILVGFEISNNFNKKRKPQKAARDIYGVAFDACTDPLSQVFWNEEVIWPLQQFAHDWNQKEVSNGIPLSGVVFDLEMYFCRPGMFMGSMGFSPQTIKKFDPTFTHPRNVHDFVSHLGKNQKTRDYFSFLTDQATRLGAQIKSQLHQHIPNCMIGCYVPNLSIDWFYKGFYAGLSSVAEPLLLLSFNTEFEKHKKWLARNNIFAEHSGALMLSKLKHVKDIPKWIDYLSKHHSSLWINRFSRLVEPYKPNQWFTSEQTPLDERGKQIFLEYLKNMPGRTRGKRRETQAGQTIALNIQIK